MNYNLNEKNNNSYIYCTADSMAPMSQNELIDLIPVCWELGTNRIMLDSEAISEEFFRLRTGFAGEVLQKYINYGMIVAVLLSERQKIQGKFEDLMLEMNRGKVFRIFTEEESAVTWLIEG